ncbi:MAG: type II secretion system protein GspC, partial [Candidatus Entotheonellia bacterium]
MSALKRYMWIAHLALIALLAYTGADLFWAIAESRMEPGSRAPNLSRPPVQTPEQRAFQQYAVVQERNLFGGRGRQAPVATRALAPTPTKPAPARTAPNLKLVGTVVGSADHTYAVIEDLGTKKQDLYRLGDLIRESKIVEIARQRVLIDTRGRREELLSFQQLESGGPAASESGARPPIASRPGAQIQESKPRPEDAAEEEDEVQQVGENTWRVSRDELSEQFDNLGQHLTEARLTPHFTAGQPDGFMLTNIPKNSVLERIGLRNGDILKGVNGQKFGSLD